MKNDNLLLAEYLGLELDERCLLITHNGFSRKDWCPDEDWNQLMMVVQRIEEDGRRVSIELDYCEIYKDQEISACHDWNKVIVGHGYNFKIKESKHEAVYNACVEYINHKEE